MIRESVYMLYAGLFLAGLIVNDVNLCLIGLVSTAVCFAWNKFRKSHSNGPDWGFIKSGDTINFVEVNGTYSAIFTNNEGKYGFCDEMWTDTCGPFDTYGEACKALEEYSKMLW